MKLKFIAVAAIAAVGLVACGKKDEQTTATQAATPASTTPAATSAANNTQSNAPTATPPQTGVATAAQPTNFVADSTPLSSYEKVDDSQPAWLTYLVVTHDTSGQPQSQEDSLNLFSPRYFNEHDQFKKHDLIATEWPAVQTSMSHYKGVNYIAIPFGVKNSAGFLSIFTSAQAYDFNTKSFPLTAMNMDYVNQQNVSLRFNQDDRFKAMKVEDENLARQIEALRTQNKLNLAGVIYAKVEGVQGNRLQATIEHVHYDVYDELPAFASAHKVAQVDI